MPDFRVRFCSLYPPYPLTLLPIEIRSFETLLRSYELRSVPAQSFDKLLSASSSSSAPPQAPSEDAADAQPVDDDTEEASRKRYKLNDGQPLVRVVPEMRGHTSFLTFASLLPPLPAAERAPAKTEASS